MRFVYLISGHYCVLVNVDFKGKRDRTLLRDKLYYICIYLRIVCENLFQTVVAFFLCSYCVLCLSTYKGTKIFRISEPYTKILKTYFKQKCQLILSKKLSLNKNVNNLK